MHYLKLSTMEFPLFEGDIRLEYPAIPESATGDSFICPDDYVKVEVYDHPPFTEDFAYVLDKPVLVHGNWVASWRRERISLEAKKSLVQRADLPENRLIKELKELAEMQMRSATLDEHKNAWSVYLQELNDYFESYPRQGRVPHPPKISDTGQIFTTNDAGSAPDVFG